METLNKRELRNVIGKCEPGKNVRLGKLFYESGSKGLSFLKRSNGRQRVFVQSCSKGIRIYLKRGLKKYSIGIPYCDIEEIHLSSDNLDIQLDKERLLSFSFEEREGKVEDFLRTYISKHLSTPLKYIPEPRSVVNEQIKAKATAEEQTRPKQDNITFTRTLTFVCPSCSETYILGKNTLLVSDEDVRESMMKAGAIGVIGNPSRGPELAIKKSLSPEENKKLFKNILSISTDLANGIPRYWTCYKCKQVTLHDL